MKQESTPDLLCIKGRSTDNYEAPFVFLLVSDLYHVFAPPPNGQIYRDFYHTREFGRLGGIKQLGTVWNTSLNPSNYQTRLVHSLVAAAMMDLVLYWNGFSDEDRHLGIAAGLCHDIATVPYSEQGKLIDPGAYEEETLVEYLIKNSPVLTSALQRNRISLERLVATIQGKGPVGKLLNSKQGIDVDNLSYLAVDCMPFFVPENIRLRIPAVLSQRISLFFAADDPCPDLYTLANLPNLFSQYKNLRFIDNKWVFSNPFELALLLKFRALMYQQVYNSPEHRAREAFLTRTLRHYKEKGGKVEINDLLKWNDYYFERWFLNTFGHPEFNKFFTGGMNPPFIEIDKIPVNNQNPQQVLDKVRAEREDESKGTIVERLKPPRNAVRNLVLDDGKVRSLGGITGKEWPDISAAVEQTRRIIQDLNYVGVYQAVTP